PDAEPVEAIDELLQRDAVFHDRELLAVFADADAGARGHDGPAARQRVGLADLRGLGNGDGEIALRDRHRAHAHVATHHYDSAAFVDDDLGSEVRFDLKLLDLGQ